MPTIRRFSLIITAPTGSRIVRLLPEGEVTLGRNPICDIVLSEEQISRQHAKLVVHDGVVSIEDLGSNNGTFVNGERITSHALSGGEVITIGSFKLSVTEGADTTEGKRREIPAGSNQSRTPVPALARPTRPPMLSSPSGSVPSVPASLSAMPPTGGVSPVTPRQEPVAVQSAVAPLPIEDHEEELNPWNSEDGSGEIAATGPLSEDDFEAPFEEEDQTVRLRSDQVNKASGSRRAERMDQFEVLDIGSLPRSRERGPERAAEEIRRVEILARVAEAFACRPQSAHKELIDAIVLALDADTAVLLYGEGPSLDEMRPRAIHHREPLDAGEVPVSRTVVKEVLERKSAIIAGDVRGDERFEVGASLFLYNVASVIAAPLMHQSRVLGVLYVNRWRGGPFEERDLALVSMLAHMAALAQGNGSGTRAAPSPEEAEGERCRISLGRQLTEAAAAEIAESLARGEQQLGTFTSEEGTALVASIAEVEPFLNRLGPGRTGELLCNWQERFRAAVLEAGGVVISIDGLWAKALFRAEGGARKDPAAALNCALGCRKTLTEWFAERLPRMRIRPRFGVHTARYFSGLWGPREAPGLTAVGEALEGAAHLELAAAPGEILASPAALSLVEGRFELGPVDPSRLAGVPEDLAQAFAVFGPASR